MIDFLLGVPGKLKTISDWLTTYWTSARAAKLDYLTANVAVASTAVSNVNYTSVRAAYLDNLVSAPALRSDPLISPPIATNWPLPDVQVVKVPYLTIRGVCAIASATTTSTSYVDALNITGAGVLNLIVHDNTGSSTAYIRVTIDGVVVINGLNTGATSQKVFFGSVSASDATATGCSVSFDHIPFRSSLRIEHYALAGASSQVIYKLRRTA